MFREGKPGLRLSLLHPQRGTAGYQREDILKRGPFATYTSITFEKGIQAALTN
jgi:hypothetical protein